MEGAVTSTKVHHLRAGVRDDSNLLEESRSSTRACLNLKTSVVLRRDISSS